LITCTLAPINDRRHRLAIDEIKPAADQGMPILIAASSAEAGTATQTSMAAMPATQFVTNFDLLMG
jgi:hypothetical protein